MFTWRCAMMCSLAALARGCRPAAAAAKPCCLCWCCCCSCSCLAVRGSEGGPGKKPGDAGPTEPPLSDGDAPPTLEEIQSWGQSFDRLMRSAAGRKVFRDFLRGEYSEENIMFWLACEELKRETDPDAVEEKARFIYEDYISILSPKEVSLDSRVREIVNRNMVEPTPHTFDEAQLQIYTLMHRDSYPRFVNSPLYKTLARLSSAEPPPSAPSAATAHANSTPTAPNAPTAPTAPTAPSAAGAPGAPGAAPAVPTPAASPAQPVSPAQAQAPSVQ
ncbi:regulator of G-protein signaling 20 isoform X2 [Spodoptera frugiperda]|uniref:Regulator of G-protein signaling 20 isoform X2 n=2 Tax=Spodoptera frugiperda TaxID=7108 RepID=A0A9R0DN38_SPOFR|nr:regulator of G-protein signaling 20 isoform X2 [Spodoptera frugiperda]